MPVAAVFGSSTQPPDAPCCRMARELGGELARLGITVKNGGYLGVMEAVSRGAREAGGEVIGVTLAGLAGRRAANGWLSREIPAASLLRRLEILFEGTDYFFALEGGGPGTLNEVFLAWASGIIGLEPPRPVFLIGRGWPELLVTMERSFDAAPARLPETIVVPDVPAALARLRERPGATPRPRP